MDEDNKKTVSFAPSLPPKKINEVVEEAIINETSRDKVIEMIDSKDVATVLTLGADHNIDRSDPAWVIIHALQLISEIEKVPARAEKAAEDAATRIGAESIMKANQELMKIRKQADTVAAEAILTTHRLIEEKIGKEIRDGASELAGLKRSIVDDKNESVAKRFAIPAVIVLLAIGAGWLGGGGMFDQYLHADYDVTQKSATNWDNFVSHWQNATGEERATIRSMMDRKL